MKRFLVLLTLIAGTLFSGAAGLIIVHEPDFWDPSVPVAPGLRPPLPRPRVAPNPPVRPAPARGAALDLLETRVEVRIQEQVATTTIHQEFYNPASQTVEGTFLFPVPKGAQLDKFSMEIGGKMTPAELLTSERARRIYEEIVRKLRDPALLEYFGQDLFKVRIFPIEGQSRKRVRISFTQLLKADGGLVEFALPLQSPMARGEPIKNLSVKVDLESKRPLKTIYSPSHQVEVRRHGESAATVGFEGRDVRAEGQFQLYFGADNSVVGANLLAHRLPGEDGHFLLFLAPGMEVSRQEVVAKDIVFVLDTSGSMAGPKLEQAKKALQFCVANLNPADRFEIIRFATETEGLFQRLVAADPDFRKRAHKFVEELNPIGGTAINDALQAALKLAPRDRSDRPFIVIFLTDGRPTVGVTASEQILEQVRQRQSESKFPTRIFGFGIGTDVNTHLLDLVSDQSRGFTQYILPEEDIELKISSFYRKIKDPVLANIEVDFLAGAEVNAVYPRPLPDLYRGEQLILSGRYRHAAEGKLVIKGTLNGKPRTFSYDLKFPGEETRYDFVPRLWATRRVGYLLDEIRLRGENPELRDEVAQLARRFGIVTPYTAYLILEDEAQRNVPLARQSLPGLGDAQSRTASANFYQEFKDGSVGQNAALSARYGLALKAAENAPHTLAESTAELRRNYDAAAPMPAGAQAGERGGAGRARTKLESEGLHQTLEKISRQTQETRNAGGRAFFKNGDQWIDAELQRQQPTKHVRIQFDSPEYFELLNRQPQAHRWLALGRNVQFVLGDTQIEIHD